MLVLAFLSLPVPAPLQDIETLLQEGDPIPSMGNVVDVQGLGVDPDGAWMASIRTDVPNLERDTGVFSSTSGVVVREHDLVPSIPGARYDHFFGQARTDDHGLLSNVRFRGVSAGDNVAAMWDGVPVARKGDLVQAAGVPPGAEWVWFPEVSLGGETALVLGEYLDGVDQLRALVSVDAGGTSQAILIEGDPLPGSGETIQNLFNVSASPNGHSALGVLLSGPSNTNHALAIDGQLVLRSGDPSSLPGWSWHSYMPAGTAALNRHAEYACGATIIQGTEARNVLVRNGEVLIMGGEVLPDIAPHAPYYINVPEHGLSDDGDVVWTGLWQLANGSWRAGVFLNRRLVAQGGGSIDGHQVASVGSPGISSDGRYVWFNANTDNGQGFFRIDRQIGDNYCGPAVANSTGSAGTLTALGSLDATWRDLRLEGRQLPPGEFGYFLASKTEAFVPAPGGSQGNLCLGGLIGRFTDQIAQVDADGELCSVVDLSNVPPGQGGVMPGETWHFQAWYRDVNPTPTSNFTDGVRITFE